MISHVTVIEVASGEYGEDKIQLLTTKAENGRALDWFEEPDDIPSMEGLRKIYPLSLLKEEDAETGVEETPQSNQRSILIKRGFMKAKRDSVSALNYALNGVDMKKAKNSQKCLVT